LLFNELQHYKKFVALPFKMLKIVLPGDFMGDDLNWY